MAKRKHKAAKKKRRASAERLRRLNVSGESLPTDLELPPLTSGWHALGNLLLFIILGGTLVAASTYAWVITAFGVCGGAADSHKLPTPGSAIERLCGAEPIGFGSWSAHPLTVMQCAPFTLYVLLGLLAIVSRWRGKRLLLAIGGPWLLLFLTELVLLALPSHSSI